MRCRTSLNANQARRQRSKEPQYVGSPYPLANDNRVLVVDTVNLKDILCDIEADPDRGHGDLSSEQQCCPADPIRSGLGSSGGRPPHLDSNYRSHHGETRVGRAMWFPQTAPPARRGTDPERGFTKRLLSLGCAVERVT